MVILESSMSSNILVEASAVDMVNAACFRAFQNFVASKNAGNIQVLSTLKSVFLMFF